MSYIPPDVYVLANQYELDDGPTNFGGANNIILEKIGNFVRAYLPIVNEDIGVATAGYITSAVMPTRFTPNDSFCSGFSITGAGSASLCKVEVFNDGKIYIYPPSGSFTGQCYIVEQVLEWYVP